jgi:glycosyltransferase involved in cell wall biosynthesis
VGQVEDVAALIRGFDLFVLPSRWEGFGLVLLEAMAQSCPIVATRVGGIPEVVADGETGLLVPPGDVGALASAIGKLIDDPSRRRALGRAGHARFRHRFTAERMAEETATVYDEAMAVGAGRPSNRGPRARFAGGRTPAGDPALEEVADT